MKVLDWARRTAKRLLAYFIENPGALFIVSFQISLLIAAYYLVIREGGHCK